MPGTEELSREELVALVAAQAETIVVLRARVAELERRSSRHSGNSSLPPSSDDVLPGRAGPARRAAGAARGKRGRRKGAGGSWLAWSHDPDDTVGHRPEGVCGCGADLAGAAGLGVARSHQVHDVPLVTARVVQHDLYRVRCGCGREHVAGRPGEVSAAPVSYRPNLRALVVYLLVFQHLPVERAAVAVRDATGAAVSTGFVHGVLARAAPAVAGTARKIKELVVGSPVAGFDETTLRAGPAGTKNYLLSASTDLCVVFGLGGRDLASFQAFGVLTGFAGTAVHDRYSVDDHADFAGVGGHQLCVAHLLGRVLRII